MNSLNWENIESVWNEYFTWYSQETLETKGLTLFSKPDLDKKIVSQSTFAFLFLWINTGFTISKTEITDGYRVLYPDYKNDFQAGRHIGNGTGYNITNYHHGKKGYCLVDKTYSEIIKRSGDTLTEIEWVRIKSEHNNECACCGSKEGELMSRANGICKLEKGHMDPFLPLTPDNIIPQCQYCNGASKDKRKFNKKGETIAIKNKIDGNWVYC